MVLARYGTRLLLGPLPTPPGYRASWMTKRTRFASGPPFPGPACDFTFRTQKSYSEIIQVLKTGLMRGEVGIIPHSSPNEHLLSRPTQRPTLSARAYATSDDAAGPVSFLRRRYQGLPPDTGSPPPPSDLLADRSKVRRTFGPPPPPWARGPSSVG